MENTEYGIWTDALTEDKNGSPEYARWDEFRNSYLAKDFCRKIFKELDEQLISLERRACFGVIRIDDCWCCCVSFGKRGDSSCFHTASYSTPNEAICEGVARIRTYINSIVAVGFLDEIRPRAAAAGLVIEAGYFGGVREDDLLDEINVRYSNGVPAFTEASTLPQSNDSNEPDDYGPGPLLEVFELQDPLWQTKLIGTIQHYEARAELDKFITEFPDIVLNFSPDERSFEVPYLYRRKFVQNQFWREFPDEIKHPSDINLNDIARTLGFIPVTQTNLRDLAEVIRTAWEAKNASSEDEDINDIPEDTAG